MRRVKPATSLESAKLMLLRRRIQRYLPRRPLRFFIGVAGLAALGIAGVGVADLFDHGSRLRDTTLTATGGLGFAVQEIEVEGRTTTSRDDLLKAIEVARGTPILAISPAKVKQQLETLPWVRTASVERHLPDTLHIRLTERVPLALWQRQGKMMLIDHEGVVVTTEHLERYANLLLVVGEDAPRNAEALIQVLQTQPDLMRRVSAAIRVGERRWNLQLDNAITVELPESNVADAWTHLAQIDRSHALLARDIELVDLRLTDRVVVRAVPETPRPAPGKQRAKTVAKT
ncbi:MAG: cell division protein FtsQ/DivIB [Aliidongia sp.]